MFRGFTDETVDFMWGIRFNNERTWFEANKGTYLTQFQQPMRELAAGHRRLAKRIFAVYYLITGMCYSPTVQTERIYVGRWCPALRERYHAAACTALNYERAAESTTDVCLRKLLQELGEASYREAEMLLGLLERSMGGC